MAMPRRYANHAERQAAYRARAAAARKPELQSKGLPSAPPIPTMPGVRRWEGMRQQSLLLLETWLGEMQAYYDQRSATWQASERGEAMKEQLQALAEVTASIEELKQ